MAVTPLNTIKNWFKTGLIPTQLQFWATWDSFRHKSEKVPVADVEGIDALLLSKAEASALQAHIDDEEAHSGSTPDASDTTKGITKLYNNLGSNIDGTVTQKVVNDIYIPNALIRTTLPTRSGNDFTFPALGYDALISKTLRTNPALFTTTISVATTNYKRKDLIYFKPDNTLAKLVGTESLTTALLPDLPPNCVAVYDISVYGSSVENPTTPVNQFSSIVSVKTLSDIANKVLDPTKLYQLDAPIVFTTGQSIIVPAGGLTIQGLGFNVSSLFSNVASHTMFTSPAGGSGDLILLDMAISTIGTGAKVFDIFDVDGTHAIEIEYVNFNGCKSIGKQKGYRQGTMTTIGFYGCADGLQLSGTWNGYKISNSNCFGFGATGTLFKKDTDTSFTNRFFLQANIDFPTGAILCDFQASNFTLNELFQINSTIAKVNGVININNATALVPNITANDLKSLWIGNIGLPDTASELLVDNLAVTTTFNVDWFKDTYYLEQIGNTTFSEINLPANGKNTQEITIYLHPKGYTTTFPVDWLAHAVGTLKNNELNELKLKFIKTGIYFLNINNSLSVYPAPDLSTISPVSITPSTTAELNLYGSFFTPATIVSIEGQTVNSIEFINSGHLRLSITTGVTESEFDITINNGTSVTFTDKLIVNLGDVFVPDVSDWINQTGLIDVEYGGVSTKVWASEGTAQWSQIIDYTKDFRIDFKTPLTPLGQLDLDYGANNVFKLLKISDSALVLQAGTGVDIRNSTDNRIRFGGKDLAGVTDLWYAPSFTSLATALNYMNNRLISFRWVGGVLYLYIDNVLRKTFVGAITENVKIICLVRKSDLRNLKYIELP